MSLFFRLILLIVIAPAFSLLPVAAQDNAQSVTMALTRDPVTFDPQGAIDPSAPVLLQYVYETLLFQDEAGDIHPFLAESWTVEDDGKSVVFALRQGVTFSNGSPFNADSVIFTFERLQEVGQRSFIYSEIMNVEAFEKVDDYTVRFRLREPSATLLSALTYAYAAILDPAAVEAAGDNYGMEPVGTGPYMLTNWVSQNSMTLTRNPHYAGQHPLDEGTGAIDEIRIRFTADQSARVNALLAGEIDIAYLTSAPQLARLQADPDFTVLESPSRGLVFIGFNTARPPFDDPAIRRAVSQAIQKQDIVDVAAEGMGVVVNTPLAPSIFGYDPALEQEALPYDPDAAHAALEAAGLSGTNVTLLTSNFPGYETMATVIQAQLAQVGISAEVEVLDFAAVAETATAGDYNLLLTRYDWNDPDLLRIYLSEASMGRGNRYFYANPDLDALTARGKAEFDPETRREIYAEAQRIVMEDMPWIPLHMGITKVVVNNRVQNVRLINSHVFLNDATIVE